MNAQRSPQWLDIARLVLVRSHPYLASAAFSIRPIESTRVPTAGMDAFGRLYWSPEFIRSLTQAQQVGLLYHELSHWVRNHASRARPNRDQWNLAADCEINGDLKREGHELPDGGVYPESYGYDPGLLAESYYAKLGQRPEPDQTQDQDSQPEPQQGEDQDQDQDENASNADENATQDQDGEESDTGDGSDTGDQDGDSDNGQGESSDSGEPSDTGDGEGEGNSEAQGDSDGDGQGEGSGNSNCQGEPSQAFGGSCSDGEPRAWEDAPPASTDEGNLPADTEAMRQQVAIEIAEALQSRGDIPGSWARYAKERTERPTIPWQRELQSIVQHATAHVVGAVDYTRSRISRRQSAYGRILAPAMHAPSPEVAIVLDTSGSMDDQALASGMAEIDAILKACGIVRGVTVLCVDASVGFAGKVFSASAVKPTGGGGTDMRVGIDAALELRPRPQIVIVITDGYSPFPVLATPGVRLVIALTENGTDRYCPDWAKVVRMA